MKTKFAVVVLVCLGAPFAQAQVTPQLVLQRTFALPVGTGKFDHFAIDLQANRLFMAATGNHTIEILDLDQGKVTETITGLGKPHGLAWIAETKRLYASDGSMGDLKVFEGSPLKQVKSIKLSEDADDLAFDARTKLLYVGHGGTDADNPAKVAVIDTANQTLVKDLPVATHPEGLGIDNAKGRIFVNVADAAEVAVIDGAAQSLSASWKISRAADNVPIAFDGDQNLLFVACRTPGRLVVLDSDSGKEVSDLPADEGADDLFYDAELHRIYLIAGSGAIDTYEVDTNKGVRSLGATPTAAGAKTGLLVPSKHALYVGVVAGGGKEAEIRVYSTR
jgi:DNA-binding beta-propeller fold protein YncE